MAIVLILTISSGYSEEIENPFLGMAVTKELINTHNHGKAQSDAVSSMATNSRGTSVILGYQCGCVAGWSLERQGWKEQVPFSLSRDPIWYVGFTDGAQFLASSLSGSYLANSEAGRLTDNLGKMVTVDFLKNEHRALVFVARDPVLCTAQFRILDLKTKKLEDHEVTGPLVNQYALLNGSEFFLSATDIPPGVDVPKKYEVCAWDLVSGSLVGVLGAGETDYTALSASCDGAVVVGAQGNGKLQFFLMQRARREIDDKELLPLVVKLGSGEFTVREKASEDLVGYGVDALSAINRLSLNGVQDPEVRQRIVSVVTAIKKRAVQTQEIVSLCLPGKPMALAIHPNGGYWCASIMKDGDPSLVVGALPRAGAQKRSARQLILRELPLRKFACRVSFLGDLFAVVCGNDDGSLTICQVVVPDQRPAPPSKPE